jgi:hypothetical protein
MRDFMQVVPYCNVGRCRSWPQRAAVENLCMTRAYPVDNLTAKFISLRDAGDPPEWALWRRASRVASLDRSGLPNKIVRAPGLIRISNT